MPAQATQKNGSYHLIVLYIFLVGLILMIVFGPQFWAKHVLAKYNKVEYFSGNGFDLARLLLDKLEMEHVKIESVDTGDHYDPIGKVIRLTDKNCGKKTLTAVVVASHEVGHAIQDFVDYQPLTARTSIISAAVLTEKIGATLLIAIPFVTMLTRIPASGIIMFICGMAVMVTPVIVHFFTLPVEWDASFNRALPILSTGEFIAKEDILPAKQILLACAFTYVANALASILNVMRWIRVLKR